jgi:hypothetical protein
VASPALLALRGQRLHEVRALLGLRPRRQLFRRQLAQPADAVNRAGVVVLTAHLEGYVEDLIVDVIDELDREAPATSDLPTVLLAEQVSGEFLAIAEIVDRAKRASRIEQLFRTRSALWLDPQLAQGRLSADTITGGLSNPGAKEIARVLGLLGMADVFANIQLPDGADPAKRINELIGIRNSIAHGGGATVSDQQVDEYVRSVEAVGDGLERAAAAHVHAICRTTSLPWP